MKTKILSIIALCFLSVVATAQIDRSKMPKSGPAPSINLGTPQKFKLDNGLQVLVVENHKLPRASASLFIDNPPKAYGDKKGVEGLLSGLLGTGTTKMSKEKFDEEVDFLGIRTSFSSGGASLSSLKKYFSRGLELMADGALNPVFTQEEFDKQQKQTIQGIQSGAKSVTNIARKVERALLYGKNHPYGESASEKTVSNVTLQDVKDLYNTYYKPNNAYLVIIGDVDFASVKKEVTKLFGKWQRGTIPTMDMPKVSNPKFTEINFIDMPNAVQSEMAITNVVNLKMGDKDYFAALLANQILGGGGTARLYKNLREDKGYTYGAYSSIGADRHVSRFRAGAAVRNMVTDSSMVEFMREINKVRYQKATQEELDLVKSKYTGNFIKALERPSTVANYALNILINDLPEDYYTNYLKNINAVKLEDVQNAAVKYFQGDNARIIITGKGIDVLKNLEKTSDYAIKYFDKEGNPTDKPAMSLPIPAGVTAATVVDKYYDAIGGKDKVAAVNSVMTVSDATVQGTSLTMETKLAKPNKSSIVISVMGNQMQKIKFNGTSGYQESRGQKAPMQGKALEAMKNSKTPFADEAYKTGKLVRIEPIDGKLAYVLKVENKEVFYDKATGLKIKEIEFVKGPQGEIQRPTNFSDYKEVNGIKFPHKVSSKMGPMNIDFVVKEVKVNSGVTDADFQ